MVGRLVVEGGGVVEVPRPGDLVPWAEADSVKYRVRNAQQARR